MKRRREALFPEINTNHWRITYLSQGRLQIEAAEATGKTNSGGEGEPPLRFHYPWGVLLVHGRQNRFRGGTELHLLANPGSVYRLRSAREVGVNIDDGVTGFIIHVRSGHFVLISLDSLLSSVKRHRFVGHSSYWCLSGSRRTLRLDLRHSR